MSSRHPIIAVTGSSGAGATSVTRTFTQIFRREEFNAAIVEGWLFASLLTHVLDLLRRWRK